MQLLVRCLILSVSVLATMAGGAQARTNVDVSLGIGAPTYYQPAPVYYEPAPVVVYRPYSPVGYRNGFERHREYDYGYWERERHERHDHGKHKGWDKHQGHERDDD